MPTPGACTFTRRRRVLRAAALTVLAPSGLAARASAGGRTLKVGPGRSVETLAEAARRVRDGDTVEVDAGDYHADPAAWRRNDLTLRTAGGRVRLHADGAIAEGKGLWVVRGERIRIQGFDFIGTRGPMRNGAGIRFEAGSLGVYGCRFLDNEMGLLTGNDPGTRLVVERCEFAHNRRPDGHNHQLYAGTIGSLVVRGSWFHHASIGHLLKSRAATNLVEYSRLVDDGGDGSYELEFPNGGLALVRGNVIAQGPRSRNEIVVSYGAEGYRWSDHALVLVHNTLVDRLPQGGRLLRVMPGAVEVRALNNLTAGGREPLDVHVPGEGLHNVAADWQDFVDADALDFRLRDPQDARWQAAEAGTFRDRPLAPAAQYAHPCETVPLAGRARVVGAWQPR